MRKIAILGFLFLLVGCSGKNELSKDLEMCKGFEDTSSLNPRFKIKGIWAWDNFTSEEFQICNTSSRSKKGIQVKYYNPTNETRYIKSESFSQELSKEQILSPGVGELYLCPSKKAEDSNEKIYSASITPIWVTPKSSDKRELGIKLIGITEYRMKC